jgi:hypothetical protein
MYCFTNSKDPILLVKAALIDRLVLKTTELKISIYHAYQYQISHIDDAQVIKLLYLDRS